MTTILFAGQSFARATWRFSYLFGSYSIAHAGYAGIISVGLPAGYKVEELETKTARVGNNITELKFKGSQLGANIS